MRWRRLAGILSGLIAIGCAGPGVARPPEIHLCPQPRPPLVDAQERVTDEGLRWINVCLEAGRLNCVQVADLRGEDPKQCDQGLKP